MDLPYYIWNCDESGVQDVPKEEEVVGVVHEKANSQEPSEHGETSTVLTFANVCGQVMPSIVIYKGKQVSKTWTIGTSRDVIVCTSVKGYINKGIFYEYAECWVQYLRRRNKLDKTNILLLDAHKSHKIILRFLQYLQTPHMLSSQTPLLLPISKHIGILH